MFKKIGELILDNKFIGLDGFDEIEAVPGAKTTPKRRSKDKPQHAGYTVREHKVIKKKVVLAAVTSMAAVVLSGVTVAGAIASSNGEKKPAPTMPATQPALVTTADEAPASTADSAEATLCGLYVDGELVGVTTGKAALEKALDKVLTDYKKGYDAQTTTEFANKVEVKELEESERATLTAEELVSLGMDKFSINLATDYIYKDVTEYETVVTYDETKPASYKKVTKEGKNGITEWTVRYTFTDGEITDSEITGSKVTQELVNEEVVIGTGEEESNDDAEAEETYDTSDDSESDGDSYSGDADSGDSDSEKSDDNSYTTGSSGSFIWPLPHTHNLTSLFEWRWGRMHNGIDIAGGDDYGQPIIASDSGTVTWSGNDGGGYGTYVVIDHGNGYTTIYGHASELACSTGDFVNQGDVIAYVGSTGNSTGPHLHFEIRENDEPLDPLGFVG